MARGPTQRQIELLITAQDKTREALDSLRRNFRELSRTMVQAQKDSERLARAVERMRGSIARSGQAQGTLRQISAGMRQVQRDTHNLSLTVDHLSGALRGALAAAGIDRLIESADAYRRVLAKVAIHVEDAVVQQEALNRLVDTAIDTWVKIDDAAFAFTRFAQALKPLGITFEELLRYVRFLNQAVALSGSTSKEAHGALLQFSQAISNNFRTAGQELNSVIEQTPALADMIARGISKITGRQGLTGAHLKKLAEEGVLTSELVVKAMEAMFDEAEQRFDRMPKTVEASLTQLYNAVVRFVGDVDRQFGLIDSLNTALESLRANLQLIVDVFSVIAIALLPRLIAGTASFVKWLLAAGSAVNPWLRLATILATMVGVVIELVDHFGSLVGINASVVETISRLWRSFRDDFAAYWELVKARAIVALEGIAQAFRGLAEMASGVVSLDWERVSRGFATMTAGASPEALERLAKAARDYTEAIADNKGLVETFWQIQRDVAIENTERANRAAARRRFAESRLRLPMGEKVALPDNRRGAGGGGGAGEVDRFAREVESLVNKMLPAIARQREYNEALAIYRRLLALSDAELAAFGLSQERLPALLDAINEKLGEQATFLNTTLRQLDEQIGLARMGNLEREIEGRLLDWVNEARKQGEPLSQREIQMLREKLVLLEQTTRLMEFERDLLEDLDAELLVHERTVGLVGQARERALFLAEAEADALRRGITDQARLQEILAKAAAAWDRNREAIARHQTGLNGIAAALDEYLVAARDRFTQSQELMREALRQTEDALVRFAETGRFSFEELARSMLASITRVMANRLTAEFFALLFGEPGKGETRGGLGGLLGSAFNFFAGFFHSGGWVEQGKADRRVPALAFVDAPRFHRGGIAGDEVPAILRRGEIVLTPSQYRSMIAQEAVSGPVVNVQMTVNTPDAASFQRSRGQLLADLGTQIQRAVRRYR